MAPIDLTKIFKEYRGKWVALSKDGKKVLGSGTTANAALRKGREKAKRPTLYYIPTKALPYVGGFSR